MNLTSPAPVQTPARPLVGRSVAPWPIGTQRPASSPSAGEITCIRVDGHDLAVGDVVRKLHVSSVKELRIDQIVARSGPRVTVICTNLRQPHLAAQQYVLGSASTLEDVVGGPKLEQARQNPELVEKNIRGWMWKRKAATT